MTSVDKGTLGYSRWFPNTDTLQEKTTFSSLFRITVESYLQSSHSNEL